MTPPPPERPLRAGDDCYDEHQAGCECVIPQQKAGPRPPYIDRLSRPATSAASDAEGADALCWLDGHPTGFRAQEWFIAMTTYGDRVVLRALPEEYSYDFKTADETYIKKERVAKWMPFPDSKYTHPSPALASPPVSERERELEGALRDMVGVVRAAGVGNLMNGVKLGQVAWGMKATDALDRSDQALTAQPAGEGE